MSDSADPVLITGGSGFLGQHVARSLAARGIPVRLFDIAGEPGWAAEIGAGFVRGDVRDAGRLAVACRDVRAIVHAAFASPTAPPRVIETVNAGGARRVCEAAVAAGVPRLVVVSSTIVENRARSHPLSRRAPLSRLDLYRRSRVTAETLIERFSDRLSIAIARPKTFLGPGRVGAFAILFDLIRRGRSVPLLGPGRNSYQLLDVRDLADGIARLAATDLTGVLWFGADRFGTVRSDLEELVALAGTGARVRRVPAPIARAVVRGTELLGMAPLSDWHHASAEIRDSVADLSRARTELGWQPERSNVDALADAFDWYSRSMDETGSAGTTAPVPLSHRLVKEVTTLRR